MEKIIEVFIQKFKCILMVSFEAFSREIYSGILLKNYVMIKFLFFTQNTNFVEEH